MAAFSGRRGCLRWTALPASLPAQVAPPGQGLAVRAPVPVRGCQCAAASARVQAAQARLLALAGGQAGGIKQLAYECCSGENDGAARPGRQVFSCQFSGRGSEHHGSGHESRISYNA